MGIKKKNKVDLKGKWKFKGSGTGVSDGFMGPNFL